MEKSEVDKFMTQAQRDEGGSVGSYVFSIEWHKECLRNHQASLNRKKDELDRLQRSYERDLQDLEYYAQQIEEAKRQGKKSFDREKFLKKRAAQQGKKEGA